MIDLKLTKGQWQWYKDKPPVIQELIQQRPPNCKYRIRGQKPDYYILHSYLEDGTMTAYRFDGNSHMIKWGVFNLRPESLIYVEDLPIEGTYNETI